MKKIAGFLSAAVAVLALSGCGGGGSSSYDYTYYLQTFNGSNYVGVPDVYYECGPDIVGYTGPNGEFHLRDGDICTFYDLDEFVSAEYDILYLGANASGTVALEDVDYTCDSSYPIWSSTDSDGAFTFDPTYYIKGDICDFDFY
ncbi:MAG: lipoprotein [Campylobacterales bacterium]|nr:lipoprotein [Campylobacterales bacterium]